MHLIWALSFECGARMRRVRSLEAHFRPSNGPAIILCFTGIRLTFCTPESSVVKVKFRPQHTVSSSASMKMLGRKILRPINAPAERLNEQCKLEGPTAKIE